MRDKEENLTLQKDGRNIFSIYHGLRKIHSSIKAMFILREIFPELSLTEAKEIMIMSETDYSSIEDYHKGIFDKNDDVTID